MGAALSFLGQKLFASSTLISARFENISCCTSVAAIQPPIIRRTGGLLRKRMTVDSRKRVVGLDSNFEVAWESLCTCRAMPGWPSIRSESTIASSRQTGAAAPS